VRLHALCGLVAALVQAVLLARRTQLSLAAGGGSVGIILLVLVVAPLAAPATFFRYRTVIYCATRVAFFSLPNIRSPLAIPTVLRVRVLVAARAFAVDCVCLPSCRCGRRRCCGCFGWRLAGSPCSIARQALAAHLLCVLNLPCPPACVHDHLPAWLALQVEPSTQRLGVVKDLWLLFLGRAAGAGGMRGLGMPLHAASVQAGQCPVAQCDAISARLHHLLPTPSTHRPANRICA